MAGRHAIVSQVHSLRVRAADVFSDLPCQPCPHRSACCRFGTSLTAVEAWAIARSHGADAVRAVGNDLRTAVRAAGCVFAGSEGCSIHGEPYYPSTCQGFPTQDRDGGPYQGDLGICPELAAVAG